MMCLTMNWVAVALSLTAAVPGVANPGVTELKAAVGKLRQVSGERLNGPQISYRVRVVEMEGLEWRQTWFDKLTPVTHRGSATVWTASRQVAQPIVDRSSKIVASPPRVTSFANTAAHFSSRSNRSLVTQVSWSEEEPKTASEAIREGFATTIAGRKLDQGVLVQVVIDDTEIRSVHDIKLSHGPSASTCPVADGKPSATKTAADDTPCCQDSAPGSTVQVAEVASQEVVGEWLIPNNGVLVVGLGIHTASGKDGKAVVRERLMMIEATDTEVMRTASRREAAPGNIPLPSPSTIPAPVTPSPSTIPMPTPSIPSRALPQGIHADGSPAELPPLPEESNADEADASAEPHGSPQSRKKDSVSPTPEAPKPDSKEKKVDSQSNRAGYIPAAKPEGSPLVFPAIGTAAATSSKSAQALRLGAQSFPASLNRWIESVRARGLSMGDYTDCCEETDWLDECKGGVCQDKD